MKVKDLIRELQGLDQEKEVLLHSPQAYDDGWLDLEEVRDETDCVILYEK